MQTWPAELEQSRLIALAAVGAARVFVQRAIAADTERSARDAAARLIVAGRDCQRMLAAATRYKMPSGRWSARLVALRGLIDDRAAGCVRMGDALRVADGAGRVDHLRAAMTITADAQFFIECLVAEYGGGF